MSAARMTRMLSTVGKLLVLADAQSLEPIVTHMGCPVMAPIGRCHHLYEPVTGLWEDYVRLVGVGGGWDDHVLVVHTDGRVLMHLWFSRALTAPEQALFDAAPFKALLASYYFTDPAALTTTNAVISTNTGYCAYFTVDTTKAGSASNTFVLPTYSTGTTYNYEVSWGEGSVERHTTNTSKTHIYGAPGTYTVAIRGVFPQIYFSFVGDKLKLLSGQLGDVGWTSFYRAFYGCTNFVSLTDKANTSAVTDMSFMFSRCSNFNSPISNFNTAQVTTMARMFQQCTVFNQSVANFDTSKVTSMDSMFDSCTNFNQSVANFNTVLVTVTQVMFWNCTAFKQSLATFNMAAVVQTINMCFGCNLNDPGTTTNYDATLVAWAAQGLQSSPIGGINFGTSKYSAGAAAAARQSIIDNYAWTPFTDGGIGP